MSMMDDLNSPSMQEALDSFKASNPGAQFDLDVTVVPEYSTHRIPFDVVAPYPVAGGAAPTMAHAVFRADTLVPFFDYGQDQAISDGLGSRSTGTVQATEGDTSLLEAHSVGDADKIITSISISASGLVLHYDLTDASVLNGEVAPTDPDVLAAYQGKTRIYDPQGLVVPSTMGSPLNLHNVLLNALLPNQKYTIKFSRGEDIELGMGNLIPEGAAAPLTLANGLPTTDNRLWLPQALRWARDGQPGSRFEMKSTIFNSIVIPFPFVPGLWDKTDATPPAPLNGALLVTVRLHGPKIRLRSNNG